MWVGKRVGSVVSGLLAFGSLLSRKPGETQYSALRPIQSLTHLQTSSDGGLLDANKEIINLERGATS